MFGPFPIAHLLRITRDHEAVFRQVETKLTKQGYICFAPVIYDFDIYLQHKQLLKDMCYEKLLQADLYSKFLWTTNCSKNRTYPKGLLQIVTRYFCIV